MCNSSGSIVARYSYDPYGRTTLVIGSNIATVQYTGDYTHQASGLNFTLYRAYDSNTGRWLSRDPIEENGGINLYDYVHNDPDDRIDPLGEAEKRDCNYTIVADHGNTNNIQYMTGLKMHCGNRMGFVGCDSDPFNDVFVRHDVGIPGLPRNNAEGLEILSGNDVNSTLWAAWNAAMAEARKQCASKTTCCKQITVRMVCGAEMKALSNATISKVMGLGSGP
jgi:RHS repeat-associated protein